MIKALVERGWEIKRTSGVGCAVHPKHPHTVNASIAAAVIIEFGKDGLRRFDQAK